MHLRRGVGNGRLISALLYYVNTIRETAGPYSSQAASYNSRWSAVNTRLHECGCCSTTDIWRASPLLRHPAIGMESAALSLLGAYRVLTLGG